LAISLRCRSRVRSSIPNRSRSTRGRQVGLAQRIDLELRHRLARFLDDRVLPLPQLLQEIGAMKIAHEFFFFRRTIARRNDDSVERNRFFVEKID
jgi:hypothetical protein